jgi:hypothetical protein
MDKGDEESTNKENITDKENFSKELKTDQKEQFQESINPKLQKEENYTSLIFKSLPKLLTITNPFKPCRKPTTCQAPQKGKLKKIFNIFSQDSTSSSPFQEIDETIEFEFGFENSPDILLDKVQKVQVFTSNKEIPILIKELKVKKFKISNPNEARVKLTIQLFPVDETFDQCTIKFADNKVMKTYEINFS